MPLFTSGGLGLVILVLVLKKLVLFTSLPDNHRSFSWAKSSYISTSCTCNPACSPKSCRHWMELRTRLLGGHNSGEIKAGISRHKNHKNSTVEHVWSKVKVHTLDIAPLRSESPLQKRSGMARVLKGFQCFTCTSTCSSAIGMSHTCLCLPSWTVCTINLFTHNQQANE